MSASLDCLQWMSSQEGQNPCSLAQEVGQLCDHAYTVLLDDFEESTYVPNTAAANGCTCSWSIYNLLSACSYCVGEQRFISWGTWIGNCGSYVSNTSYLPSGLSISQGIPFWAATDPSAWENEVFNITQAADIAAQNQPDVTGGPLPTSPTSTSATSSGVSVGEVVGLLIGGISVIIIGALFVLCAVYRRRRKAMRGVPFTDPSVDVSQSVVMPPIRNQMPVHPSSLVRASAGPTRTPPYPVTDSADIISPFLAASPTRRSDQAFVSPLRSKVAEVTSGRVMAAPGRRPRLNPPPYSDSVEPGSSISARRASTGKERRRRVSRTTTVSVHSAASTRASVTMAQVDEDVTTPSMPEVVSSGVGATQSTESTVRGGDSVETAQTAAGASEDSHPPAV